MPPIAWFIAENVTELKRLNDPLSHKLTAFVVAAPALMLAALLLRLG